MATQEPTISVTVRMSVEMSASLDAKCEVLLAETGTTFGRADVVRMAVAKYLGLVPEKNGLEQTSPDA